MLGPAWGVGEGGGWENEKARSEISGGGMDGGGAIFSTAAVGADAGGSFSGAGGVVGVGTAGDASDDRETAMVDDGGGVGDLVDVSGARISSTSTGILDASKVCISSTGGAMSVIST